MPNLRRAFSLSSRDWQTLLLAWGWLLAVDLGLRLLPFRRLQRWVTAVPRCGQPLPAAQALPRIAHTAWLVDVARRYHLARTSCLRRSLVLQRLLLRQCIPTELRFGVRRESGQLLAHAWLEYAGQPVSDREALSGRFIPLALQQQPQQGD